MKSTGKAAVVAPHGDLYRGNWEGVIRREIIKRGYIKGIIGLPPNLFYGTGIAACILVLDKEGAEERDGIFMIDASRGFMKDGDKNRLREQDIHRIVDTFNRALEEERYSRWMPLSEVEANDYNLSIARYIDPSEPDDIQDIEAHLYGGIPDRDVEALDVYWDVLPGIRSSLFLPDRPGYSRIAVENTAISAAILEHSEFAAFRSSISGRFAGWAALAREQLKTFMPGGNPKLVITKLSEELLAYFRDAPLVDAYDIYQRFMEYAQATLQDDLYLVSDLGWIDAAKPRRAIEIKKGKTTTKEPADFYVGKQGFKSDLLPVALLVDRYFGEERDKSVELEGELATASQAVADFGEEHGTEEGLLAAVVNDKGALTKTAVNKHMKDIRDLPDMEESRALLARAEELLDGETRLKGALKAASAELDAKIAQKFGALSEAEIIDVSVNDKWLGDIGSAIGVEVNRISRALMSRVVTLASRYVRTLPEIQANEAELSARVAEHLRDMGFDRA